MVLEDLILHCYDEHVKDIGGTVFFTIDEYVDFWVSHTPGTDYHLKNRNGSVEVCRISYYPLPYFKDLRALIEIHKNGSIDFREVPVRFLTKIP